MRGTTWDALARTTNAQKNPTINRNGCSSWTKLSHQLKQPIITLSHIATRTLKKNAPPSPYLFCAPSKVKSSLPSKIVPRQTAITTDPPKCSNNNNGCRIALSKSLLDNASVWTRKPALSGEGAAFRPSPHPQHQDLLSSSSTVYSTRGGTGVGARGAVWPSLACRSVGSRLDVMPSSKLVGEEAFESGLRGAVLMAEEAFEVGLRSAVALTVACDPIELTESSAIEDRRKRYGSTPASPRLRRTKNQGKEKEHGASTRGRQEMKVKILKINDGKTSESLAAQQRREK